MSVLLNRLAAIFVAVGLLFTAQTLTIPQRAAAADPGYLMVHFTGEGSTNQQMYLAHSTDGLHWNDLNGGGMVLRSPVGTKGVRDPAFVRSPDGEQVLDHRDRPVHRLRADVESVHQRRQPQPCRVGVDGPGHLVSSRGC